MSLPSKYAVDTHGHTGSRVGITKSANFLDALAGGTGAVSDAVRDAVSNAIK